MRYGCVLFGMLVLYVVGRCTAVYCVVGRCTVYYGDVLSVSVEYCVVGRCAVR